MQHVFLNGCVNYILSSCRNPGSTEKRGISPKISIKQDITKKQVNPIIMLMTRKHH